MNSILTTELSLADIGKTVRNARKAQKLTQAELGQAAGLSRMPVYRIEAGQDVSLRTLLSIVSALRLGLQLQPLPQGVPSAQALQTAFSHLHGEDDA
jgi:HTH-type transcriptional regulator / antitoxin HipB